MKSKLKLLNGLMKGNRLVYLVALASIIPSNIMALIQPLVISVTIDSIIGDKPIEAPVWIKDAIQSVGGRDWINQNLWICVITLAVLAIFNGLFAFLRGRTLAKGSESISRSIRDKLYCKFQQLTYDYHVKAQTGDLVQRCTSDVETVRQFMAVQLVEIWNVIFLGTLIISITSSLHSTLTLLAVCLLPIILLFSFVFFAKIRKLFKECDEAEGSMSTVLQENLTGVRVVKAFATQKFELDKFSEKNEAYKRHNLRLNKLISWFWSLSDMLCGLQISIAAISGIYLASKGEITLGTFFVFMAYESMLIWPVRRLGRIFADMGKMTVSLDRINEVLSKENEDMTSDGLRPEIKGNIEFKNVSFEYDDGKKVLEDISFSVRSGQTVAILGATGSGKSTLVHLLLRLYDYQKGSITLEGVELKEIDKKWLRKNIGLVLQEPFLFSRTIRENIALSNSGAKEDQIIEAARIAAVHNEISSFEKGYDTLVGERGVTLSGGQKQRVAIARSIITNSPILVFDDSLSAVDTGTDAEIRSSLAHRTESATAFIISHRISTLSRADLILVLEDGLITQSGSHEELIMQKGLYQRIWELQSFSEQNGNSDGPTALQQPAMLKDVK
ncbi:MAG: ABC transporter ATP-binding protein [Eubacteriales bacterium]|nr:ABC transporter ATP-binding protein [Eubacteriales bacterium]